MTFKQFLVCLLAGFIISCEIADGARLVEDGTIHLQGRLFGLEQSVGNLYAYQEDNEAWQGCIRYSMSTLATVQSNDLTGLQIYRMVDASPVYGLKLGTKSIYRTDNGAYETDLLTAPYDGRITRPGGHYTYISAASRGAIITYAASSGIWDDFTAPVAPYPNYSRICSGSVAGLPYNVAAVSGNLVDLYRVLYHGSSVGYSNSWIGRFTVDIGASDIDIDSEGRIWVASTAGALSIYSTNGLKVAGVSQAIASDFIEPYGAGHVFIGDFAGAAKVVTKYRLEYSVAVSTETPDWGTVTGEGFYPHGSDANITANANPGYRFSHWEIGAQQVSTNTTLVYSVFSDTSVKAVFLGDRDEDGLDDWWEFQYFGDYTNALPSGDGDGDAYTNLEEFRNGTDPTVFDVGPAEIWTAVEIGWRGVLGTNYQVQWTHDLESGGWSNLGAQVTGSGGTNSVFDSIRAEDSRFYRVLVAP